MIMSFYDYVQAFADDEFVSIVSHLTDLGTLSEQIVSVYDFEAV